MNSKIIKLAWIIDDDEVIKYLTELMFKQLEFCEKSVYFKEPKQALIKLKTAFESGEDMPDVILLDLKMPEMDGWAFLNEMEKILSNKEIPVFIFSSSINEDDILHSKQYKLVKDYIIKPLTIRKVNKLLRQIS